MTYQIYYIYMQLVNSYNSEFLDTAMLRFIMIIMNNQFKGTFKSALDWIWTIYFS